MSEKRFTFVCDDENCRFKDNGETIDCVEVVDCLNDQSERIRKQSIRIYCQDKEIQRLLGELEKIPKSIREVWLEE